MYARSTTVRGNPQKLDEGIRYVHDKVMPAVQQMDGCVGLSMLVDRDTGRCIVTTAWADAEAMRNSADGVRSIREKAAEILEGTPEVQEWEIAVLHRTHETSDGACARVSWHQCDPGEMDRVIDGFRMSVLPRVEDIPGFCSMSVLVDRETGRCVTAATYESRAAMERSTEQAMALRQEFTKQMGMQVTEVMGFDLVLAHLRVPETV
jgi:quinol monooxygenase YgiN